MGKNPKEWTTFLTGFNIGTFLSLISLVEVLMTRSSFKEYCIILAVILVNGTIIGVVLQYLLIHIHLTKNMGRAFYYAGDEIPKRLLEMRNHKLEKTLELMVGIQTRVKLNLIILIMLVLLLILSLLLPIIYCYRFESDMFLFNIGWSCILLMFMLRLVLIMTKNSRYIQFKINHLLDVHEFNNIQLKKEEL
ncbi:hypothetical protein [Turicibacter sanguinis]|uniref:hypothetical protein n=1 Tax=Turicibacter sanguinis TaxID=154288 RepID=UPI0018AC71A4|nr:hypothetical protein [Turicibacter sanguinis]MDB8551380.1 hypothetical protein [Turicibacter sanguinis]